MPYCALLRGDPHAHNCQQKRLPMLAVSRILRPTAIGGLLSLLFGITLIVSGVAARDAGGLVPIPEPGCGTIITVGLNPVCLTGTITVTKVVTGDATVPPEGFAVTLTSANCRLPDAESANPRSVHPGQAVSWTGLFQFAGPPDSNVKLICAYQLSEAAVPGFTATFAPSGDLQFPLDGDPSVVVTLTNASATSSAPSPTTSEPAATVTVESSVATAAPTATAPALAATGRSSTVPQVALGAGLSLLGLVLITGTRKRTRHA